MKKLNLKSTVFTKVPLVTYEQYCEPYKEQGFPSESSKLNKLMLHQISLFLLLILIHTFGF